MENMGQTSEGNQSLTGKKKSKASWNAASHEVWVNLCVKEVDAGNRPGTHFNKRGWENIGRAFNQITGNNYDRMQLKNHWDVMKKEWLVWNSLFDKSETGLGWDAERGTVNATNEWWERKIQKNPEVAKFRLRGLEHCFELDKLYMDVAATGERAWAPNSGQLPEFFNRRQSSVGEVEFGNDGDDDGDGNGDGEDGIESQRLDDIEMDFCPGGGVEGTPLPERQNKRGRNKGKVARKETSASKLSRQIDRLVGAVETRSSYSPTVSSDKSSDIAACVAELETIPDLTRGDELYWLAVDLFLKKEMREMFMALPDNKMRLEWLHIQQHKDYAAKQRAYEGGSGGFQWP